MEAKYYSPQVFTESDEKYQAVAEENIILRKEIQVARRAAELTANLVVKQFEETEKVLHRFQVANAQRKAVLDSATQNCIIATDKKGIITVFNTGAERLLGYSAEELIGRHTPEIFHIESELELFSIRFSSKYGYKVNGFDVLFEYAVREQSEQLEWTYVRKDGTQFPVRMTINALREPDGDVSGLLCIAMDIAAKKRSEKALRESERKYKLLVRNLPNIVYKGYLDGSVDFFDNKIERITGYSKEEFLSRKKNWFDVIYEEDVETTKDNFREALRADESYMREYRIKSKEGKLVWIEEGGQIVCGEDGEIEFITGAFLDITERKLAEEALHESEEKYRSLFNSGPNPIFVVDQKTQVILDANPMAEETYGYLKKDLIGRPFNDLGPVEDVLEGMANFDNYDWPTACVIGSKVQHYQKNKKPFYVRVTACPIRYKDREAIILATTDITEMLEKEAQLLQADKMTMLGEMSAGVAHELNQPLNAIKMGNEYLKMMVEQGNSIPEKDLLEVASQASEQVDRASEIINRLREFGHKPNFAKVEVDVNKPIQLVAGMVKQQLGLENIHLDVYLEENLPHIWGDNNSMEQVILNLVTNSRDAIHEKKETHLDNGDDVITIRSFRDNDRVAVSVSDTGAGIPEADKNRIFEPFFTTKEVGKGMGLGLSITYGIVKDYGGEIELYSDEGTGTTFKLTFPFAQ
jgi:PAS domain S-box-containing protein